jgi:hypothetical protein
VSFANPMVKRLESVVLKQGLEKVLSSC